MWRALSLFVAFWFDTKVGVRRTYGIAFGGLLSAMVGVGGDAPARWNELGCGVPELTIETGEQTPEFSLEPFPFLVGEQPGSVSVGDTSHGYLIEGVPLRENEALAILPEQRKRGLRYGTAELIGTIDRAAKALHKETGTRLWVGNISKPQGGDIDWSVSHNAGRDADLAFCYTDHKGKPVDPPDLVPLSGDGMATNGLRFDAARTWMVVKALLTDPATQVQFLFIASGLEQMMLMHARAKREPAALLERAAQVMWQPSGSAAHHDHLHLRLYCSRHDVAGGCTNTGIVQPGARLYVGARLSAVARARAQLDFDDETARRAALDRLALLQAREHSAAVTAHLHDPSPQVRRAAALALARVGGHEQVPALLKLFLREEEPLVRIAIVQAVGALGGSEAGDFLSVAVGRPQHDPARVLATFDAAAMLRGPALVPFVADAGEMIAHEILPIEELVLNEDTDERIVQLAALDAASRSERLEPVPALIALLDDRNGTIRASAAHALSMITNMSYGDGWEGNGAELDTARSRWSLMWRRAKKHVRDGWVLTGFNAAGYRVPRLDPTNAWELVRAVGGRDHVSYNAQRVLARMFDRDVTTTSWTKGEACRHWLSWLNARRASYGLLEPPDITRGACHR